MLLLKNTKGKKALSLDADAIDPEQGAHLMPEVPDDMWHLNNLIHPDDRISAKAIRKISIKKEKDESGILPAKPAAHHHVTTFLTIRVTSTSFDPDPKVNILRVSGVVAEENEHVAIGQHHTIELELNRPVTLWKKYGWDIVSLQMLKDALNEDKDGAIAAVVMQEGLANICLITDARTILQQRVEVPVPRKRSTSSEQDAGMKRFYEKTLSTLLRASDFASEPRPLLLASPGFVAQDFRNYIVEEGARRGDKVLQRIPKDAYVLHSSSGHKHALSEVLAIPEIKHLLKTGKHLNETRYMDEFYARLRKDDNRAWYGLKPVVKAVEDGAVGRGGGVLLINHDLFHIMDVLKRREYGRLVERVRQDGGEWKVLSGDHESGERLAALGGIAAILTYPMYDLDESEGEDGREDEGAAAPEGRGGII